MVVSEDSLQNGAVYALAQERSGRNRQFTVMPRTTVKGVLVVSCRAKDIERSRTVLRHVRDRANGKWQFSVIPGTAKTTADSFMSYPGHRDRSR